MDNAANNINAFQNIIIPGLENYFIEEDRNDNDTNDTGAVSNEYEYSYDYLLTTYISCLL
ncbi:hypothetical protein I4U23_016030 [Adineta vaga]|nr:hypothetical protein I4U23_016030 [Adineta vaga]